MLALLKPIVLTFLKSEKFKVFVIDLLEKLSKESDNDLDDKAVEFIKRGLKVEYSQSDAAFKSAVVASPFLILFRNSSVTRLCNSLNCDSPALLTLLNF